jgi:competence protein ComEC
MGGSPPAAGQTRLGRFARRPAVGAAAALMVGIALHSSLPDRPALWLAIAAAAAIAAVTCWRWGGVANVLLAFAMIGVGASVGQLERFHFRPDDIVLYTTDAPRLAEVELEIDQPPRVLTQNSPAGRPLPPRQVTGGVVKRVKTLDGWREASGNILLQISPPNLDLAYGQRVAVMGMLSQPMPAMNPGQFDWQRYYREQRILVSIDAPDPANVRILAAGGFAPINWLRERARAALAKGFTQRQAVDHALLRALLLGDGDPQLRDIQADFVRTGTSHHLSISGMHVAVLGGVIFLFCRLVRLSPRKSACVMMGFVVLYGVVALPAPPVVRSIILCLTFGVGVVFRRAVDGIQLLALTIFIMLVIHPLDLYNAGFQLSFGTVLGLMLYATRLTRILDRQDEDERVLMLSGIPPTRAQSIRKWIKSWLIEGIATGLVAWAISAPLIVEHFDQVNPWAIPAGMLLALPVFASMVFGLGKVVLTLVIPGLATQWAWLAALPVEAMRLGVSWLAKIPGSDVALPAVPVFLVGIYYALLLLPLIPTARTRVRWIFRGGAMTACATALMLPLLIGFAPRRGGGEVRVTLLSVGAGQCAVVELPSGKTVLIDAGTSSSGDLERRCLEPFLRHEGSRRVDSIYISHANFDHFSAVAAAVADCGGREVIVTPQFTQHAAKNYPARLMLRKLAELKCPVKQAVAGEIVQLDEGVALEMLWPPPDMELDANNSCQVMRLTYRGRSILFTGDVQAPAESALMADEVKLKSDVLIAPHHGSAEETTARFLDAVAPSTILASNDRTLSGKQREFDKITADRTVLRTHLRGAITVRITPDGKMTITTFINPR